MKTKFLILLLLILLFLFASITSSFARNQSTTTPINPNILTATPTPKPTTFPVTANPYENPYLGTNNFFRSSPDKGAQRGIPGDGWADIVLGQPDFTQITPNEVVGNKLFNPGGIIVDRTVQPNRVYVYDAGNSRVLGLTHLGTCQAAANAGLACTSNSDCPESICQIEEDRHADIVFGQPSFTSSACNGDSGVQNYPTLPSASASSLCGMLSAGVSILESGTMATMAIDSVGNLYVPDNYNHRVLRYNIPFESDAVADHVWGQSDFSGTFCNHNQDQPNDKMLCLAPPPGVGDLKSGVAIDSEDNLWVTDTQNNRVLRFPFDINSRAAAKKADLVLGQPDFSSATAGNKRYQMDRPSSIRIDNNGIVYVADGIAGEAEGRVLVFAPPYSNGMSANSIIENNLKEITGLEIGPDGGLWINDSENNRLLKYMDGILEKTVESIPARSWGGLGIDRDSNVMVTGWDSQQVLLYSSSDYLQDSVFLKADDFGSFNQIGARGFHEGLGLEVTGEQLIYADGSRILFWNDLQNLTNFQAADGVIGEPDFTSFHRWGPNFYRMRADDHDKLWVVKGNMSGAEILAYELPLASGDEPIITISSPIRLQGGGEFDWTWTLVLGGIDIQPECDCLWLSDSDNHRVFRIKDVSSEQRVVDIVLGQKDKSGIHCNHGRDSDDGYARPSFPTQDSLCHPGALSFDNNGNLFVSDHNLEHAGNERLLAFNAETLPKDPITAVFGIPATKVLGRNNNFTEPNCLNNDPMCGSWEPAFDSQGHMLIGYNGYLGPRFPQIYQDPLVNPLPITALNDFSSQPVSARFDEFDNLYVLDLTRHRIMIYDGPIAQTFSLTGRIKTEKGNPISEVSIETVGFPASSLSNELGIFELNELFINTYTLSLNKQNCTFTPSTLTIDVPFSEELNFVGDCVSVLYLPIIHQN